MKQAVVDMTNKKVGELELEDQVFGSKPNKAVIYEAVKMYRANKRLGTHSTLTTKMVSGTTAKMYRQKGTGRARHGSAKAHIFVGGGIAFGPHPRDYSYTLPRKVRQTALLSALALKYREGKLLIVDDLPLTEIKTKKMVEILSGFGVRTGLIVLNDHNEKVLKSSRNIPGIKVVKHDSLNALDLMSREHVVFLKSALVELQEGWKR
ncbi:MAG: 50S ribosomal protein L4 [Deltaproteobacteria bacterium]|nr:50S ribosomal protein L4 [Deltaproteobacteria bacterium]